MIPFFVSGSLLVLLLITHRLFKEKSERRIGYQQLLALTSVLLALSYGMVGSYILRDQFANLKTWLDALYFTVVTYATVGYGDITPLTPQAKAAWPPSPGPWQWSWGGTTYGSVRWHPGGLRRTPATRRRIAWHRGFL